MERAAGHCSSGAGRRRAAAEVGPAVAAATPRIRQSPHVAPGARCGQRRGQPRIGPALVGRSAQACIGSTTGLDASDRRLLELLLHGYWSPGGGGGAGGPRHPGLPGLARIRSPWETVVEPYCLQLDFLLRTPVGSGGHAGGAQHLGWRRRPDGLAAGLGCSPTQAGLPQLFDSGPERQPRGPLRRPHSALGSECWSRPPRRFGWSKRGNVQVGALAPLKRLSPDQAKRWSWSQQAPRFPISNRGIAEEARPDGELAEADSAWVLARDPAWAPPSTNLGN